MSGTPVTPPGGIDTGANPLSPDARGAMRQSDNCVMVARDKMESRRGSDLSTYVTSSGPTTIGEYYNDTLFVQHGTKLSRDTGSAFTEVGTHSPPSGASMKFVGGQGKEANGSLYFTTSTGVYGIDSVTATPKLSGIQRPGDFYFSDSATSSRLTGNPNTGWMPINTAVAYRAVMGRRDANNNIKLSAPSGRLALVNPAEITVAAGALVRNANVVTMTVTSHTFRVEDIVDLTLTGADIGNFDATNNVITSVTATTIVWAETAANYTNVANVTISSGSKNMKLVVDIPLESVAGDFVRLYRTFDVAGTSTDPGDECFLAYERVLTSTDISNGYVTVTDTTPTAFLGEPLYTNENSGDGLAAANDRAPHAKDIALFDGRVFYANTTGRHRLNIRLLGTGSSVSGLQTGDGVAINTRVMVAGTNFTVATEFTASLNIQRTVASLVYATTDFGLGWKTYSTHDGDNGTGGVLVEETGVMSTPFNETSLTSSKPSAIYAASSRTSAWADPLASLIEVTEASTSRTTNVVTVTTAASHGFATNDVIMLAYRADTVPDANFVVGLKTVTSTPTGTTFTYAETGSNATMTGTYYVYATTYKSIADTLPIVYSKPGLPEAVPLLNFIQDIPKGQTVLRIMPLREMLFVFLQYGDIWTISGGFPYRVEKFDGTATLLAEGSLVEHNNRLLALTTQGVVAISEGGVEILDEAVKPELQPLIAAEIAASTLGSIRACSYESEHQYRLYLSTTSSYAVWIYNSLYRKWTRQRDGVDVGDDGRAWGIVRRSTNKLVEGHTTAARYWLERKSFTRLDYGDRWASFSSGSTQTDADTVDNASGAMLSLLRPGDVLFLSTPTIASNQIAWTVTAASGSSVTATPNSLLYTDTTIIRFGDYVASFGPVTLLAFRPIENALEWLHDSAGSPHTEKQFRDLQLHFSRHSVNSHSATFSAIDGSTAATGTIAAAAPQAYSFATTPTLPISKRANVDDVTAFVTMTPQLAVGMTVSELFSVWTLLGYTLEADGGSEKVMT